MENPTDLPLNKTGVPSNYARGSFIAGVHRGLGTGKHRSEKMNPSRFLMLSGMSLLLGLVVSFYVYRGIQW